MAGRLSFSIAINLLTENFKRGTNQVKAAFRSMQMQILTFAAALGAGGLGLSNLVSRFIDVARETNRVTTALKNVSGTMSQYADNQKYLLDLAKKYGLEINALTANYAKFTAAASISGMSMIDQRKVFESVSRACTAFGMSADDSNGVMLALSQMMSKGKISSEELRLQMGERLPVALQAMAKAAGVSVAGLDKLLKQGKLMSKDVLPKFAEALNEMIPNVDTDNLETSVNRLKNVFTELVNGTDIQSKYKALIDWLTNIVKSAADNIKSIVTYLVAAVLVMVTSRLVNKIISSIAKAELAAKSAARRAAKDAGQKFDEVAWKAQKAGASIRMAFSKAMLSIKATLISMAPTAILAVIGAIVAKFYNAYKESQRIKGLFDNYLNRMNHAAESNSEIVKVKALLSEYNKVNSSLDYKKQILGKINGILGTELKTNQDVNKEISKRIELLESAARAELAAKEVAESENELRKIGSKSYNGKTVQELAPDWEIACGDLVKEERFKAKHKVSMVDAIGFENGLKDDLNTYIEFSKILSDAKLRLGNEISRSTTITTPTTDPDDDKKKKTHLQKQQESYDKQFEELGAELEIGKITQAEYNKALGELNIKMYAQAKGTGDKEVLESQYFQNLKTAAEKAIRNQDKNAALVEFEKVQKDYNTKVREAQAQQAKGLISQKELNSNIVSLSVEAAKSAAGIKGIGDEADVFISVMQLNAKLLATAVKIKPRDTTFDYKKTKADIASENLDKAKELADKYKEEARIIGETLSDEIANAMANVPSMEEALKLAQVQEDIKNFGKELDESLYSGVKDIASGSDRIVNAFSNLRDVMNDVDATEWERIMAIWNTLTNVIDSFMSICKMIENITELTNKLTKAKEIEGVIEKQASDKKIIGAVKEMAVDTASAETKKANSRGVVAANTAEAATAAGKSVAGIPIVGIALAAAAVAGIVALFATLPKFARGGIIGGGPTSGDKMLARVNAGEMILNQGQQSHLFEAINSGRLGGGGNISSSVTTRVRAKDLILTINNELKSQGKKPIS
ncbi:tape measure protein [Bacteroides thetaiotaomicron]|jgi:tape measure domain-containing protein|uniref:tape measure protein n=1 Tax=Bacteroides thetaiotaomicron TaxID=818 RepID=UPI001F47CFCE|nr:tape measure protein [Bacteroides thetaiotaomicron]MCE8506187.1 tape measure protein [Bacteroides thetaiotaomicron]MDC2010714.1 tape measure protein [Bacteroides thetaiotaomicron]MDC2015426.1 tape measure protein [Bacteroides thetaiotaomicron]MDC2033277.1 tape measure protein [Bacteroides thetaiotaomicron]MDC2037394.1 tape measure protein [Bacteroides thetaiotaomicron]